VKIYVKAQHALRVDEIFRSVRIRVKVFILFSAPLISGRDKKSLMPGMSLS
jgi:hypothetical protein